MEKVTIVAATPELLYKHWGIIRRGIVDIKKRMKNMRSAWRPEHVREAITSGQADLWLGMLNDTVVGYTVTQVMADPFIRVPTHLFVWLSWRDKYAPENDVIDAMETFLSNMSRIRGLEYMECGTNRLGLARRLEKYGWRTDMWILRKELYPEEERL